MQNRRQRSRNTSLASSTHEQRQTFRLKPVLIIGIVIVVAAYMFQRGDTKTEASVEEVKAASTEAVVKKAEQAPFPSLDTTSFTNVQLKMLEFMQTEYAKQPTSYDSAVLTYTEGYEESWCADFISWVRFQADKPFDNPETGYWRIPGVQSLRDYYASSDAYHFVGTYTPKFGDVAFYFGETPDGTNREHVAFVLAVKGSTIITLGGNETDKGILQLRSNKLAEGEHGLSGFGESNL